MLSDKLSLLFLGLFLSGAYQARRGLRSDIAVEVVVGIFLDFYIQ